MDTRMQALIKIVQELGERVDRLADKLDVTEEHTCENYNRLSEIEEWKEKAEDKLDEY